MARQIKNKTCYEQTERKNTTSRTNLFGIMSNIFNLNRNKPATSIPLNNTARRAEAYQKIFIQSQIGEAQAQFRRLQMVQ